jgi:hypothetical protein
MLESDSYWGPVWRYATWGLLSILPILGASALPYVGSEPFISSLGDLWGAVLQWEEWEPHELDAFVLALSDVLWVGAWLGLSGQVLIVPSEYRTGWTIRNRLRDARGAKDTLRALFYRHPELIGLGLFLVGPFLYFLFWMPKISGTHYGGGSIWAVVIYFLVTRVAPLSQISHHSHRIVRLLQKWATGVSVAILFLGASFTLPAPYNIGKVAVSYTQVTIQHSFDTYHDLFHESPLSESMYAWALLDPYSLVPRKWVADTYHTTHFWDATVPSDVRTTLAKANTLKFHVRPYAEVYEAGFAELDSSQVEGLLGPVTNRATITSPPARKKIVEQVRTCFESADMSNTGMPYQVEMEAVAADTSIQITFWSYFDAMRPPCHQPYQETIANIEGGPAFPCQFEEFTGYVFDEVMSPPPGYEEVRRLQRASASR